MPRYNSDYSLLNVIGLRQAVRGSCHIWSEVPSVFSGLQRHYGISFISSMKFTES